MAPTSSTEEDKHHSGELDRHQPLSAGVVKRKRTKRPRHLPPASSSASSSESTTTEEEDMAHCLILLAQGGGGASSGGAVVDSKPSSPQPPAATINMPPTAQAAAAAPAVVMVKSERYTSRKYTEAATTADGVKAGFYVYECRTCNKCFPTFQALGGHRASHKKPRLLLGLNNNSTTTVTDEEMIIATTTTTKHQQPQPVPPLIPEVTTALSLNSTHHHHVSSSSSNNNNTSKIRVHECSICGAEFSSGQALGGHMRRHRPLNAPAVITGMDKKESINLELDLNLPAPSDDEAAVSSSSLPPPVVLGLGQFNDGNKAGLMLTASALVDCHY
ncbi:hypothetical protein PR202_ga03442 [Eleusine coracana subsp. coracana]|uniref:C2H2-type domain-containing protein n=1 Tax=Eleusine coracana subsp. coracana TaxID=191504 RepID=A0AAV5BNF8_ELECO|nr:hypothetical protein PR202_ga03442 [Eleusine coracana subsp. coracana]